MTKALEILGKTLFPATNGNIAKFLKDNDTFSITVNMTVEAMQGYGKYCADQAWNDALKEVDALMQKPCWDLTLVEDIKKLKK